MIRNLFQWCISRRSISPFGEEQGTATTQDHEKFVGYYRDNTTRLDYATNRYYSSQFGTFMTPDPYSGNISDPESRNRYSYVGGDPINSIDPVGLDLIDGFDCTECDFSFGDQGGNFGGGADGSAPSTSFSSQQAALNALHQATEAAVQQQGLTGIFETAAQVAGQTVTVRDNVVNGVVKIGTAFT